MAARDDLEIPMPSMAPSYRVAPRRREEMDPATRRLAVFAGVIGGSLLLLVGVWSFTGHHHGAGVPVIEADSRPLRVKPANPGGLQVDGANDPILSGENDSKQTLAPPPETPAPLALKAQEEAATQAAAAPPPVAPAPAAPAPVAAAVPPTPLTVRPELQPLPALRPHIAVAAPAHPAPAMPAQAAQAAAPAPQAHSVLAAAAAPTRLASAAPAAAVPAPVHAGATLVQLAAVHSEQDAQSEWQRLSHKYPDLLGGRAPTISKTVVAGKTFWRLRTSGFGDVAQATDFCDRIKTKGGGCSIASF